MLSQSEQNTTKSVLQHIDERGPYVRALNGARYRYQYLSINSLDPDLFIQPKQDPQKCENKEIRQQVLEVLERRGLVYARSHILNKPISALPAFDEKIENSKAYAKIRGAFAPEDTLRKVMFDVRDKYLGYLEAKSEAQSLNLCQRSSNIMPQSN